MNSSNYISSIDDKDIDFLISRWKEMDIDEGNHQKVYSTTGRKCKIMFSEIDQSIKQDEIEKKSLESKGGSRDKLANVIPLQCIAKYASLTEWKPSDNPIVVDAYYKCVKDIVLREVSLMKMLAVATKMDELYWQYCYGRMISSTSGQSLNTDPFIKIRKRIRIIQNEVAISIAHFRGISLSLIDHIIKWRKEVKKEKLKKEAITIFWGGQNYLHKMMEDVHQLYNIPTIRLWLGFEPSTFITPPIDNHDPQAIWKSYHHEYEMWVKKRNGYIWKQSVQMKLEKKRSKGVDEVQTADSIAESSLDDDIIKQLIEEDSKSIALSLYDMADSLLFSIELGNDLLPIKDEEETRTEAEIIQETAELDNLNNLSAALLYDIELAPDKEFDARLVSVIDKPNDENLSEFKDGSIIDSSDIETNTLAMENSDNVVTNTLVMENNDESNRGIQTEPLVIVVGEISNPIAIENVDNIESTNAQPETEDVIGNLAIENPTSHDSIIDQNQISEEADVNRDIAIDDKLQVDKITNKEAIEETPIIIEEAISLDGKPEGSLADSSLMSSLQLATAEEWHEMRNNCFFMAWKKGGPYPNETFEQNIEGCEEFWQDMMHNPNVVEAAVGLTETFPKVLLCPPLPQSLLKKIAEAEVVLKKELRTFEKLDKQKSNAAFLKTSTFENMHTDTIINGSMGERLEKSIREYEMLKKRQQSNRGQYNSIMLLGTLNMEEVPLKDNDSDIFDLTEFKHDRSHVSDLTVFQKGALRLDMSKVRKTLQDRLNESRKIAEKVDSELIIREKASRPIDITSSKWRNKCATEITRIIRSFLAKRRVQHKWKMMRIEWATRVMQKFIRGGLGRIKARERKRKFRIEQLIVRKTILKKNVSSSVITKVINLAGNAVKIVKEEEREKRKALQISKKFAVKVNDFLQHRYGGQLSEEGENTPTIIKSQSAPELETIDALNPNTNANANSRPSSREQLTLALQEEKRRNSITIDTKVLNKLHSEGLKNIILPAPIANSDDSVSSESMSRVISMRKFKSKRDTCRESRLVPKVFYQICNQYHY